MWLDRFTIDDPNALVTMDVLRSAYGAECDRRGMPLLTKSSFGLAFKRQRPGVDRKKRTVNGRVHWCYIGIGMNNLGSEDSTHWSDLPDFPHRNYCSDSDEPGNEVESLKRDKPGKSDQSGMKEYRF